MTTTLTNCEIELSRQLGDYWGGTFTSGSKTTGVDAMLKNKDNDWIGDDTWLQMTKLAGLADTSERRISALNITSGTLTFIAVASNVANADTYRVHRVINASDKRDALIYAARHSSPWIHEEIRDENKTSGDWLKDGGLEVWTTSTNPTYWTVNAVTATQTNTAGYYRRGLFSGKLTTTVGDISQGISNVTDLQELSGEQVTYKGRLRCNVANALMLQVYDGTTTTNSPYHPGTSDWSDDGGDDDFMEVKATIADSPTEVTFKVIYANTDATGYVDDLRVTGPRRDKIFIGDLDLAEETPYRISCAKDSNIFKEPWIPVRGADIDTTNGWLYIPSMPSDYRLRIEGAGYLSFKLSGAVSTNWGASINIASPQLDILVAEAARYLTENMMIPTMGGGTDEWEKSLVFWERKLERAKTKFSMRTPTILTEFSV